MIRSIAVATVALCVGLSSANSRADGYKPCFEDPVFEESAFAQPKFEVPEFARIERTSLEIEEPVFHKEVREVTVIEKPQFIKPEFVKTQFDNQCTKSVQTSATARRIMVMTAGQPASISLMQPLVQYQKPSGKPVQGSLLAAFRSR